MLYQVFDTQAEAQDYAEAEAAKLPHGVGDITTLWDIPRQIADGRWVVVCMDGDGVEWQAEWQAPVDASAYEVGQAIPVTL